MFSDIEGQANVLSGVDISRRLEREDYKAQLRKEQGKLHRLALEARERGISTVLAFEGWDAAGKGGVIRRVTQSLEPGDYRVIPVAAPTEEERKYHYLWRFWRDLPAAGQFVIFDRTWYGRVLVERIEGFAETGGMAAGLRRDQRLRAAADRPGLLRREVLAAHLRRGAAGPFPGPRADGLQAAQDHRRGLPQPGAMGRVRRRGGPDGVAHDRRSRALARDRGQRQVVRPGGHAQGRQQGVEAGAAGQLSGAARRPTAPVRCNCDMSEPSQSHQGVAVG
ncbi:MAG: hypothetical protein V9G10_15685 [Candidatus Nanopelagicales bacterium]